MNLLDRILETTYAYIDEMPKTQRKQYGQFFTSRETARFMASLFTIPDNKPELTILDAGAGSGVLSAALLERIESFPSVKEVHLVCYENDPNVIELLKKNLEYMKDNLSVSLSFCISQENYIVSQESDYNNMIDASSAPVKYDLIIGNPPYKKIPKDAAEALAMPDVCYGAPNL